MLSNKELKNLEMWKRVIDCDRFRTPLIEELTLNSEYEYLYEKSPEYTYIFNGELLSKNEIWKKQTVGHGWDTDSPFTTNKNKTQKEQEFFKQAIAEKEIRTKKETPIHRLKAWLAHVPLKFFWHKTNFVIYPKML